VWATASHAVTAVTARPRPLKPAPASSSRIATIGTMPSPKGTAVGPAIGSVVDILQMDNASPAREQLCCLEWPVPHPEHLLCQDIPQAHRPGIAGHRSPLQLDPHGFRLKAQCLRHAHGDTPWQGLLPSVHARSSRATRGLAATTRTYFTCRAMLTDGVIATVAPFGTSESPTNRPHPFLRTERRSAVIESGARAASRASRPLLARLQFSATSSLTKVSRHAFAPQRGPRRSRARLDQHRPP